MKKIEKKTEKPKEVNIPPFPAIPKPLKDVNAKIDWERMPRQTKIDWKNMPAQKEVKFPKQQKVYVENFPNEISNRTLIEKDDMKRPKRIVEEFDNFKLETNINRRDTSTEITTKKL